MASPVKSRVQDEVRRSLLACTMPDGLQKEVEELILYVLQHSGEISTTTTIKDLIRRWCHHDEKSNAHSSSDEKWGQDLTTVNKTEEKMKKREMFEDGYKHDDIFAALDEIGLQRSNDYVMCCLPGEGPNNICMSFLLSNDEEKLKHIQNPRFHSSQSFVEVPFVRPTLTDVKKKAEYFWETTFPKRGGKQRYPNITKNAAIALYVYTLELEYYLDMNRGLRENDVPTIQRYRPLIYHLLEAFKQIERHSLLDSQLYRGINLNIQKKFEGLTFVRWYGVTSSTSSSTLLSEFLKRQANPNGTVFIIRSHKGIRIGEFSGYPMENEILLPPNTLLKIEGKVSEGTKELLGSTLGCSLGKVFVCEVRDASDEDIQQYQDKKHASCSAFQLLLKNHNADDRKSLEVPLHELEDCSLDSVPVDRIPEWMLVESDVLYSKLSSKGLQHFVTEVVRLGKPVHDCLGQYIRSLPDGSIPLEDETDWTHSDGTILELVGVLPKLTPLSIPHFLRRTLVLFKNTPEISQIMEFK
eukprot:PhF_6_TR42167/c0_g1_i1/m.63747